MKSASTTKENNREAPRAENHQEFLDSLKQRHNVDEQTIANLEMRMNGKQSLVTGVSECPNQTLCLLIYVSYLGSFALCGQTNGGILTMGDMSRQRAASNGNSVSRGISVQSHGASLPNQQAAM